MIAFSSFMDRRSRQQEAADLYQRFEQQGGHAKDYAAIITFLDARDARAATGASVASSCQDQ